MRDTTSDAYLSFESGEVKMLDERGDLYAIGFVPLDDTAHYGPGDAFTLLETETFSLQPEISGFSLSRAVIGEYVNTLFNNGRTRFEVLDAGTREVLASFGLLNLGPGGSINLRDTTTISARILPRIALKVRVVLDNMILTNPDLQAAVLNIFVVEEEAGGENLIGASHRPTQMMLGQNYPNPFNPVTTIRYELPRDVNVVLKLYDILGKEVGTLVDGFQKVGYHQLTFDASNLATGIYFYRLTAGSFTDVKKLLVVK